MREKLKAAVERLDGFIHSVTGLGSIGSKGRATEYEAEPEPSGKQLNAMFAQDWLAAKIVKWPVDRSLVNGFEFDSDEDLEAFNLHNNSAAYPAGKLQTALYSGRLFGGAALVAGFSGAPEKPWSPGEALKWTDVCTRHQLEIVEREDDKNAANFGEPKLVRIIGDHPRLGLTLHASRVIWCEGAPALGERKAELLHFWHESVLRAPLRAIERYGFSWEAVSHMLQEADTPVLHMAGLVDSIGSEEASVFRERMQVMRATLGLTGMLLLDAGENEKLERHSANLGGVTTVLSEMANEVAAAAGIQATFLFGTSPAGMNATGESDIRIAYDELGAYRTNSLEPKLMRLLEWQGAPVPAVYWQSLWQPTALETEQLRLARFQADAILMSLGVDGIEIAKARNADGSLELDLPPVAFEFEAPEPPPVILPPPPTLEQMNADPTNTAEPGEADPPTESDAGRTDLPS